MDINMNEISVGSVTFAKALADDTRQQIMRLCCRQWLSVGEIVDALKVTQPTVSHHLSILKAAGLVRIRREGKQTFYTINQAKLATTCCALAEDFAPDHKLILEQKKEKE
jgi:ArsR family transcriptional regulator